MTEMSYRLKQYNRDFESLRVSIVLNIKRCKSILLFKKQLTQ